MNRSVQDGSSVTRVLAATALPVLLAMAAVGSARADDRDLLRKSAGEPYVFIVLDTSSSMHWTPKCPVEIDDPANPGQKILDPADPADCAFHCEKGDCFLPRNGDDPNSKFYQAKEALYEVIRRTTGIRFGFATYNQNQLRVIGKHWIYTAAGDGPNIPGYGAYPRVGDEEVFGRLWNCDEGSGDDEKGCLGTINAAGTVTSAAALDNPWEVGRIRRLPKGGIKFAPTSVTTVHVRATSTSTQIWRLRYEPQLGSTPGQPVTIRVVRDLCPNLNCSGINLLLGNQRESKDVVFNPVPGSEFLAWDQKAKRDNPQFSYFSENSTDLVADPDPPTLANNTAEILNPANTCAGLDLNTDSGSDSFSGYNLRWPTDTSDPRDSDFDIGDLIPLDWKSYHRTEILQRLAPNTIATPSAVPDFGMASYFNDTPAGLDTFLKLKDPGGLARPIISRGFTPLRNSVRSFRNWYSGCTSGTCAPGLGWKSDAAAADPDWGCRRKYLLVLTDGDDTCPYPDPTKTACHATATLKADGVLTYVVAFGIDKGGTNVLGCMASQGGTGEPVYPQNKQDLVQELTAIFNQVKEEASAFASAAVPSVQAEVADRIYLSSFTPVDGKSVWDGHVDAFLKPLPLDAAGRPDEDLDCASLPVDKRSSCHLWDSGEELVKQAPDQAAIASAATIDASVLKIGPALDERRVFYGKAPTGNSVPRSLRLLVPPGGDPGSDPEWLDLFAGLNITGTPAARMTRAEEIIAQTLVIKGTNANPYVLGDIFHSDPVLVDRPNDFFFYGANLRSENGCGYKCFSDGQRYRRKLLVVGSNDGQLHFFDAGIWDDGPVFGTGTGRELFSFIPRLVLPAVRELAESTAHIYGIDGTPRADDVFLDPIHNGIPDAADREWRTVLIGGLREGGGPMGQTRLEDLVSGYYALDITQPDKMNNRGEPTGSGVLPDCLSLNNQPVSGCGDLPFPALLWEFTDSTAGSRWDEDLNGFADLGETWSVPTVGRVKVTVNGTVTEKFVAIFGGGMDAMRKSRPAKGNWLYMVDVETGLPIYKRRLVGSVAADPAAIDIDVDGYLDILYVGTSAGFVYKIDISAPAPLETVTLPRTSAIPHLGADVTTARVLDPDSSVVSNSSWDPVPIFDTIGRPIFYAPVAFYVASQNRFALAFGTGDRENLWDFAGQEGRFYLIIDDNYGPDQLAAGLIPLDETDYQPIDPEGTPPPAGADYVLAPSAGKQRGWFMDLEADERVITQAFGLAGVVIFSSYRPAIDVQTTAGEQVCARTGDSRIFVVYANNASALMTVDGEKSRYRSVPEFVTNPYVEQGATKNPNSDRPGDLHSEQLSAEQLEIMETLKKFFPACAKFGNYWISVSGIRSDTGYERYATIPIGICQRNWKEH